MDYTEANRRERETLDRLSAQYLRQYLQTVHGIAPGAAVIRCPNHREHAHGDRNKSAKVYANGVHCFACGRTYRLCDLIALDNGYSVTDKRTWDILRDYVGYHPEAEQGTARARAAARPMPEAEPQPEAVRDLPAGNLTSYFLRCAEQARSGAGADYLRRRGLTAETCARFLIGFDPAHIATKDGGAQWGEPEPRIIIPTSRTTYKARRIRSTPGAGDKFKTLSQPGGAPSVFFGGATALRDGKPVFICEGEFDALSIAQSGGAALALSGAANVKTLLDLIREQIQPHAVIIIMLDADKAGQDKARDLLQGLAEMRRAGSVPALTVRNFAAYPDGAKDPNDILQQDPERLREIVRDAEQRTEVRTILRRALWAGIPIEKETEKQVI